MPLKQPVICEDYTDRKYIAKLIEYCRKMVNEA